MSSHQLKTVAATMFTALVAVVCCVLFGTEIGLMSGLAIGAVTASQYITMTGQSSRSHGPIKAGNTLYGGALNFVDSGGFLVSGTNSGANSFAGIQVEDAVGDASTDGLVSGEFFSCGRFLLTGSGFTQADVNVKVYAIDNYTLTKTSSGNTYVGTIKEFVSATQVWVDIDPQTP